MNVIKENKRLWIVDGKRKIYTPPDFLRNRIPTRDLLIGLAMILSDTPESDWIGPIMTFETKVRPC